MPSILSSSTVTPAAGSTITITPPSGIQDNDVLIACIVTDGLDEIDPSTGGPSGWTCVPADGNAADESITVQMWWKVASSESGDYVWTLGSSEPYFGHIMRTDGDPNNPFERIAVAAGDSASIDAPPLNPRKDDGLLITFHGNDRDRGTPGTPGGMSLQYATSSGGAGGGGIGVFYKTLTTQYTSTGTQSSTISGADEWGAITVIVNSDESALTDDGSIVTGTFTSPTDGADTEVTIGAKTQALLLFTNVRTAAGVSNGAKLGIGVEADGGNTGGLAITSEDNLSAESDCYQGNSRLNSIYLITDAGSPLLRGNVKSWGSTSVTFEWTTYDPSNAYDIYYVAFCGDGVEASVIQGSAPATPVPVAYPHGLSGLPTTFFWLGTNQSVQGIGDHGDFTFGFSSDYDAGNQCIQASLEDALGTSDTGFGAPSYLAQLITLGRIQNDLIYESHIDDLDDTNVTINWSTTAFGKDFSLLCLKGVRSSVHGVSIPGGTSGALNLNTLLEDFGIDPQALVVLRAAEGEDALSIGAATSPTNRSSVGISDKHLVAITNSSRFSSESHLVCVYDPTDTAVIEYDLNSFGLDALTLDIETTPAVEDRVINIILLETIPYEVSGTDVSSTLETLSFTKYNTSINEKKQVDATLETLSLTAYNAAVEITDDVNVICTLETLSFTSYNTSIEAKNQVDASLETLSFTSYNAAVNAKTQVACTLETLSLTSYNTSVEEKVQVDTTLETLSLAAYATSLNVKNQVDTTLETLTFTAYNTDIKLNQLVTCTLETLALTAYGTDIKVNQVVICTLETLSLTAYNAAVVSSEDIDVVCTLETLAFTSYNAAVEAKNQVDVSLETLSFAIYASVVNAQTNIDASLETLSFTSYNATVDEKVQVDATLETLSFTAYQAEVAVGINVELTLETLSFASYNASLNVKNQVDASLETLSFTAYSSDVKINQVVQSSLETLSLAAYASEVKLNSVVQSTLGTLSLSALASTVTAENAVDATLATLSFTAYQSIISAGEDNDVVSTLETLSFAAYASSVNAKTQVDATLETLSLAAFSSEVKLNSIIQSSLETLSLAAFQSSVTADNEIQSSLETLSFTSYQSIVSAGEDVDVVATLETLSLTSYQSNLNVKSQVDSGLETLTLAAYASSVWAAVDVDIVSTLETLSFASYASTVNAKTQIDSTLGSLSLAAYSSEIKLNQIVQSTLETLSLAGYASSINAKNQLVSSLETLTFTPYGSTVESTAILFDLTGGVSFMPRLGATIGTQAQLSALIEIEPVLEGEVEGV